MFAYLAGLVSKKGSGAEKLNTQVTVKSVIDLRHEASLAQKQREAAEDELRQQAQLLENGLADSDSADEIMKKDEEPEGRTDPAKQVKRRAGLGSGMLNPAPAAPAPKKQKKPALQTAEAEVAPQASGTPAGEMLRLKGVEKADSEHGRSSRAGNKAASSATAGGLAEELDSEMRSVAEYCGGNVKSLFGLVCERFLEFSPEPGHAL